MEPSLMPTSAGNSRSKPQAVWRSPAWTSFFLMSLLIGYVCLYAGIDVFHLLRNAARDRSDLDLSDQLIKFSVIYLVSRHQQVFRTWSGSTPGLALTWIFSIILNLIVGDLLTGLVWRPGGRLLSVGCLRLSEYLMWNPQPTSIVLEMSSWLQLMAAGQIKYTLAFYLLYRSVRSLLKEVRKVATVEAVAVSPQPIVQQSDQLTNAPLPAVELQERSYARRRTRSRAQSRRR
uniref:(northern house mosquito) hypothetical protein n=1 Tax=Culex pipiens TaxID=7175 RepID=A0A8D8P7J9_CULPI